MDTAKAYTIPHSIGAQTKFDRRRNQRGDQLGRVGSSRPSACLDPCEFHPPGFTSDKVAVWVSQTGAARWSPALGEIYRAIWRDYRAGVGRLLARAAKAAGVELDAQRTALTFSQLVEGLWIGWAAHPEVVTQRGR
jgi:hypothetical protein